MSETGGKGVQHWDVTPEEAGQKLLQFLQRRLGRAVPKGAIMRWIRTGQVRVDKGRVKPFTRLDEGQIVRVPPFRTGDADADIPGDSGGSSSPTPRGEGREPSSEKGRAQAGRQRRRSPAGLTAAGRHAAENSDTTTTLEILHDQDGLLVIAKPAGLPVHGGSGHTDSVQARLDAMFPDAPFRPTPAHRLDRDTSGLLLVATSYTRLRELHDALREHTTEKTYLAWVKGRWPHSGEYRLEDRMEKREASDGSGEHRGKSPEKVTTGSGRVALAFAEPLDVRDDKSLLRIRLLTGRTHQIRVQLADRGHPILGDRKYGGPATEPGHPPLFLHAFALCVGGQSFNLPPDWPLP